VSAFTVDGVVDRDGEGGAHRHPRLQPRSRAGRPACRGHRRRADRHRGLPGDRRAGLSARARVRQALDDHRPRANRARAEQWSYEQFAAALLKTETDSRDSQSGQARITAARFPARKTPEEFDFAFQTSLRRDTVLHLGQLDFLAGRDNVVVPGPPGTGKTHLSIALGIRACLAGHRVAFSTATEWVARFADAQRHGRLDSEVDRLQRIPLLIVVESPCVLSR
jgi:DNA replication protein DnaC